MELRRFFLRRREDAELAQELEAHIAHEVDENMSCGMSEDDARRRAYLKLGSPRRLREDVWQRNTVRFLEHLLQDLRYALRTLRRMPGFAAVALLTLALGSGATTVMFTVINGVLLKPLAFPEPGRLVAVHGHTDTWNVALYGNQRVAYLDFLDCKRESRSLAMAGSLFNPATVSDPGEAEYVDRREISSDLFSVLGVAVLRGRSFLPEDDRPGAAPVAILGYSLWQRLFAGDPEAVGMSLVLDRQRYSIVGIAPADFKLDGEGDVYTPLGQHTAPFLQNRRPHPIGVLARLKPGATLARAQAELALIGQRLAKQYPESNQGRSFVAQPLRPNVGDVGSTLWLLLGAVSLVLLIACANVANLLVARAVSREREFAMRVALGASRSRVVRQCLTESAVLGLSGGALGVLLAAVGIRPFVAFWPGSLPRAEEVHLDWQALLFALAVSLLSGLLFGLAPALRIPVRSIEQTLRAGARTMAGHSRHLHGSFVVSEITMAVVLLVCAGILGRTLLRLSSLDPGVNFRNVLVSRMALSPATLANAAQTRAAWQDVLDRARRLPEVQSVALVDTVPMREGNNQLGYWTTPAVPPENELPIALATSVTPDYLKVMGIALLQGRFFNDQDRLGNEPVVVIDDVLAQHAFGGQEPVGKRLWIPDMSPDSVQVVGVVGHVRHWGLASDDQSQVRAQFYYPFAQVPDKNVRRWSELMSIAVRTGIEPLNMVEPLRRELRGAANDQVLYELRTMEQLVSGTLARQRFLLLLFGIFAGLALLLACVGIYGVLAYLTSQRIPEFGIRMALGANAGNVMGLVLRQSLGMVLVGTGLGMASALASARLLEHLVPGVRSMEPLTFASMILVLVVAAVSASFVPARRASRVDPMSALRQE
jgi:predicted permease